MKFLQWTCLVLDNKSEPCLQVQSAANTESCNREYTQTMFKTVAIVVEVTLVGREI